MTMESKSWEGPQRGPVPAPGTRTVQVSTPDNRTLYVFHRAADGSIWVRVFAWTDTPPGFWAAGFPRQLTADERAELVRLAETN
jgi:hypothetical protein